MPKLLSIKNFQGMNTTKRKLPPQQAREIQDMISERGLTKTRPGLTKYNTTAYSGGILGIFDYRRKSGQLGDVNIEQWGLRAGSYEANALPEDATPAWTQNGDDSNCSVSGGFLTLTDNNDSAEYELPNVLVSNAIGNILTVRVKGISFGANKFQVFGALDGSKAWTVSIYADKIIFYGTGLNIVTYDMDTTDSFHTYTVSVKGTSAIVWVDDIAKIVSAPYTQSGGPYFLFGIATSANYPTECLWDYVRWFEGGF